MYDINRLGSFEYQVSTYFLINIFRNYDLPVTVHKYSPFSSAAIFNMRLLKIRSSAQYGMQVINLRIYIYTIYYLFKNSPPLLNVVLSWKLHM